MIFFALASFLFAVFSGGCVFGELREWNPRPVVTAAWGFCAGVFAVLSLMMGLA